MCVCCVGLKAGDEILVVNSASVSTLDLGLIHTLFSEQTLHLVLRREESVSDEQGSVWPGCDPSAPYGPVPPSSAPYCPPPPSHFSSSGTTSRPSSNGSVLSVWNPAPCSLCCSTSDNFKEDILRWQMKYLIAMNCVVFLNWVTWNHDLIRCEVFHEHTMALLYSFMATPY